MAKILKNTMFDEIYTEFDQKEEKLRLYWDERDGPGSMENCIHQAPQFNTALPLVKGCTINHPITNKATLHVTFNGRNEGKAEFHINLTDEDLRDEGNFFCPICGHAGLHKAYVPVAMNMDKRGAYTLIQDEGGMLDYEEDGSNEVQCRACKFRGTKLYFDSSLWEKVRV